MRVRQLLAQNHLTPVLSVWYRISQDQGDSSPSQSLPVLPPEVSTWKKSFQSDALFQATRIDGSVRPAWHRLLVGDSAVSMLKRLSWGGSYLRPSRVGRLWCTQRGHRLVWNYRLLKQGQGWNSFWCHTSAASNGPHGLCHSKKAPAILHLITKNMKNCSSSCFSTDHVAVYILVFQFLVYHFVWKHCKVIAEHIFTFRSGDPLHRPEPCAWSLIAMITGYHYIYPEVTMLFMWRSNERKAEISIFL